MSFYTSFHLYGGTILLREVGDDGHRYKRKINDFQPQLFEPGTPTAATDIHGNSLRALRVDNIKHAKKIVEERAGVAGTSVYGYDKWANQFIADRYVRDKIRTEWDINKISIANIDIETECELGFPNIDDPQEPINIISFQESLTKKTYVFATGDADIQHEETDIIFFRCQTEQELLVKFLQVWERLEPDILTGWNIERFDIPYIVNRIKRLSPDSDAFLRLSPWKIVRPKSVHSVYGEYTTYEFLGVQILDYLPIYRKLNREPQSSYSLDHISNVELKDEKLKHHSGTPGHLLYREYFADGVRYNVKDVRLVTALEVKKKMLYTVMIMAYDSMTNYADVMSQIRMWDNILYCEQKDVGVQFKITNDKNKATAFDGAYVKPTIVGRHEWVVSFDVASMYPSLIRALNISPEKIVDHRTRANVDMFLAGTVDRTIPIQNGWTLAANGVSFVSDQDGFMPKIIRTKGAERTKYKNTMLEFERKREAATDKDTKAKYDDEAKRYDLFQNAIKVQLNSLYGATGNAFFRFYDVRMSEAITLSGQLLIKWVAKDINDHVNKISGTSDVDYCIASDTDSLYVNFGAFVKKVLPKGTEKGKILDALDEYSKTKMQALINDSFKRLSDALLCAEAGALSMKREVISDVSLFVAKKAYVTRVLDSEGTRYANGKIKDMGVDSAKSSTSAVVRKWLKSLYPIIMDGTEAEYQAKIKEYETEYASMAPTKLAKSVSASNVSSYETDGADFAKGIPFQSRAAVVHNRQLRRMSLSGQYMPISDGDKLYYAYLLTPNKFGSNLIGWKGNEPPHEFAVEDVVDRTTMFDKNFITPIDRFGALQGWSTRKLSTMEGW